MLTRRFNFSINDQVRDWSPGVPPEGWEELRDGWEAVHTVRTVISGRLGLPRRRGAVPAVSEAVAPRDRARSDQRSKGLRWAAALRRNAPGQPSRSEPSPEREALASSRVGQPKAALSLSVTRG